MTLKRNTLLHCLVLTVLFSGLSILTACAPKTKIQAVKPAEVSMPGVRTLAILPFKGNKAEAVRSDFYHKLNEVQHFSLLDLSQNDALDKVQWEQIDDPRNVPEFSQIQADAAVTAYVTTQIDDVRGTDQVQMQEGTGRYRKVKRKDIFSGKEYIAEEEIMRTVLKPVPYMLRTASLSTSMKAIDLNTRKILATKKVTKTFRQKYGGKQNNSLFSSHKSKNISDLPTKDATLNLLAREVASKLVAKIAPTRYTMEVELAKGSSGGYFGGGELVDKGVEHAEKGDWSGAMEFWKMAVDKNPQSAPALYNLGVAHEASGTLQDYLLAQDYYKKACRFGDDDIYLDGKVRIGSKIRDARKLNTQKMELEKAPEKKPQGGGVQIY
ncbi:MAG: tetratricopeptide repeat protein [Thermodesulfobacteriota bacterium]